MQSLPGYCIYINTLFEGEVPSVRDEYGLPFVFQTREEAEREIVENMVTRLQEYLDGQRDFEDAITLEEYVVNVTIHSDGCISDEKGNVFSRARD